MTELTALLASQARAFEEGRLDDVLGDFAYPLPVHLEDQILVLPTPAALRATLAAYRRLFAQRGVTAITPRVERQEAPRAGRFRAWLRWEHWGPDSTEPVGSRATLYVRPGPEGRALIEMVHYTHLSLADIRTFQPRAA